ncbi:hypothetical protein Rhopal_006803-T1 [Rhodotorula paludigena]|uniref:Sodium/hydrogen exchanger n=1 Tax=Rhodotorula paludigena TaxID=86838 RepID=A0AAV5GW73_9BASI|nr:hypothetical protein Rhopal_006803-T1 [Rhodotorula paludigena]
MYLNAPNGAIPVPSPAPLPDPADLELDPEVEELWSSRALLIVLVLLIFSFWISYYLKVRRIRSIHETIIAMFSGMFVGALVRLAPGHVVRDMIAFKPTILLNVLLPPIILNSGYSLKQDNFFRNFAVILTFAFCGTFISAVALGVIVYLYSLLGLEGLSLSIVECLLFGSTLSATDPVTILAIFNALHVDPKLYSVIFGESILNDAVAIVMFETLSQFHGESVHVLSFFHGVGIFLLTFCISMALGVIFGLSCSLLLKHSELGRYTEIEACLVLLIAYTSYFFSNALTMSGIVSLLFCGITLKHYAYHNMSHRTQRTTRYIFGSLASLSENFVFIYLGLSLFTQTQLVYKPMFILVTAVAMCIARYFAVFPISKLINLVFRARGSRVDELPHSYQMMLYWAGLRGAVGVALAAGMKGEHAVALRTTVLVAVVMTVIFFGGTIQRMIEILGIRTGVEEDDDESSDDEGVYNLVEGGANGSSGADVEAAARRAKRRSFGSISGAGGAGTPGTSHHFATVGSEQRDSPYRDQPGLARPSSRLGAVPASSSSAASASAGAPAGAVYGGVRGAGTSSGMLNRARSPASDLSGSSSDSDPDVLPGPSSSSSAGGAADPLSGAAGVGVSGPGQGGGLGQVWSTLDENYLLPVFSNATASRHQVSKKALRAKRSSYGAPGGGAARDDGFGDDEGDGGHRGPYGAGGSQRNKSFSDVFSALVAPALSTGSGSSSTPALAGSTYSSSSSVHAPTSNPSSLSHASHMTPTFVSPSSPMPSVDLTAAASSLDSRPPPRARGSSGHTPNSSASAGIGERSAAPVLPFGTSTRRKSLLAQGGGSSGSSGEYELGGDRR